MNAIQTTRTAHGAEPISLEELKTALGISQSDHDGYLTYLAQSARDYCEVEGNVGLIRQTIEAWLPQQTAWYQMPYAPIVSITSVETYLYGTKQADLVYGEDYYIVGDRLHFITASSYNVRVVYEAGYQTVPAATTTTTTAAEAPEYSVAAVDCPPLVKVAIERLVRDWYDNPETIGTLGRDAKQMIRKFGRRDWM